MDFCLKCEDGPCVCDVRPEIVAELAKLRGLNNALESSLREFRRRSRRGPHRPELKEVHGRVASALHESKMYNMGRRTAKTYARVKAGLHRFPKSRDPRLREPGAPPTKPGSP